MLRKRTVQANLYFVIRRAVEDGAAYGWHRVFKYSDAPDRETAVEVIVTAVMNELCEVLRFE